MRERYILSKVLYYILTTIILLLLRIVLQVFTRTYILWLVRENDLLFEERLGPGEEAIILLKLVLPRVGLQVLPHYLCFLRSQGG